MGKKMTQEQQYLIVGLVLMAFAILGYFKYLINPIKKDIDTTQQELDQVRQRIEQLRNIEQRRAELERNIAELNTRVALTERKLPTELALDEIIRTVTTKLDDYEISLQSLSPGSLAPKQYHSQFDFKIVCNATFRKLGSFLADIGQIERILGVQDITLAISAEGPTPGAEPTLSVNFTLLAYMAKG